MAENTMKIKVSENGPYIVTGSVHVDEKIITPEGNSYRWVDGREIEQKGEKFAMCRCGHSKHAPYCDGTHAKIGFDGTETASKAAYKDRVGYFDGPVIDLADDDRCAFARFCHAHEGDVWTLAMSAESDEEVAIATQTASNCPAGRLTAKPHGGDFIEPDLEPGITVVQDPEKGVSSGLYVHGGITLEGADGETYELRNRYMLCRCGASRNKPFCEAFHVPTRYNDGFLPAEGEPDHIGTEGAQGKVAHPRSEKDDVVFIESAD